MINEFGEEISEDEEKKIAERIASLPDALIDELFYRCGLIYAKPKEAIIYPDKNKDFKAIYDELLEELHKLKEGSQAIYTLLAETPIKDVLKNLEDIEKKK